MTEIKLGNNDYWLDSHPNLMAEWQWCERQFGRANNNKDSNYWNANIGWGDVTFSFNNPHHATMFALRWAEKTDNLIGTI
jgi:hypothetical protein